jgi:HEAT repeat protein
MLDPAGGREWEMLALGEADVACLVAAWYSGDDPRGALVEQARRRSRAVRAQTRIPLLAAFVCWVAEAGSMPGTRAGLYEQVLWKLLSAPWRETPNARCADPERIRAKLRVLGALAWQALGRDGLDGDEVDRVLASSPVQHDVEFLLRTADHGQGLVWELCARDGVLVLAGSPPRGWEPAKVPYLFLHRTVGEYLAARALTSLPEDELVLAVGEHTWGDADWVEVIPFAVGRLAETGRSPRPMLEELWRQVDDGTDGFWWVASLLARCRPVALGVDVDDLEGAVVERLGGEAGSYAGSYGALRSYSSVDARRAAHALGALASARSLRALSASFKPEVGNVSFVAAALGQIGSPEAEDVLLRGLAQPYDETINVHNAALEELVRMRSSRAVDVLHARLNDHNEWRRTTAARALARIGSEKGVHLRNQDRLVVQAARPTPNDICPHDQVSALISQVHADDRTVRRAARRALGETRSPEAVDDILSALQDQDPGVSCAAARALGQIGSIEAVPGLLVALKEKDWWRERVAAAEALGEVRSSDAVVGLLAALLDDHRGVRCAAAKVLGKLRHPIALRGLLEALLDADPGVSCVSAQALGKIGSVQAVPGLVAALENSHLKVRYSAARALAEIGSIESIDVLLRHSDPDVRRSAVPALEEGGLIEGDLGLLTLLRDEDWTVRRAAIEALIRIESPQALPALVDEARRSESAYSYLAALPESGTLGSLAVLRAKRSALTRASEYWAEFGSRICDVSEFDPYG